MKYEYAYGEDASNKYPDVRVSVEHITPGIADKMLVGNVNNRNPKIGTLCDALTDGEWVLNGATIVFSSNGRLLDGQNRLMACVSTGIAFDSVVVRGVTEVSQDTMDTNVVRRIGDVLKMHGYTEVNLRASIGVAILRVDTFGFEGMCTRANGYRQDFTIRKCLAFIESNSEGRISPVLQDAKLISSKHKALTPSVVGAFLDYLRTHGASDDDYKCFVDQLTLKSVPCQSVVALENCLTNYADKKKSTQEIRKTIAAILVKAWNGFMLGSDMKVISYRQGGAHPERFPDIFIM